MNKGKIKQILAWILIVVMLISNTAFAGEWSSFMKNWTFFWYFA